MSALEIRPTSDDPKTWNIMLYGPPGTGKSTAAASSPGPVLYLNADGPGALRFARTKSKIDEAVWKGVETLEAAFVALRDRTKAYKTVVIDPISEVYDDILRDLATNRGKSPDAKVAIQHHGEALERIKRFNKLTRDMDINVVWVAHEQQTQDETTGEVLSVPLTGGKKLPTILPATMDVVGYTQIVVKDSVPMYVAQLISASGRIGKDRSGKLGTVRALNLTEWITTMNGGK